MPLGRSPIAAGDSPARHSCSDGRGRVIDHEIQQFVGPDISQARAVKHGKNPVLANGIVQCRNQVFFRDGALLEELLHQLVFAFGDQFDQLFMSLLGRRTMFAGISPSLPLPLPPSS